MSEVEQIISFDQRDEFNRKEIAEKIINLFDSDAEISPLILDGAWGSGKSEFCLKLVNLSSKNQAKSLYIYVDAFKYDHTDDPLIVLVSAIVQKLKKTDSAELIKKIVPVVKVLGTVVAKGAIAWLLKENAEKITDEVKGVLSTESDKVIDSGIKKVFEDFEKADENLKSFQQALGKVASETPLVIVIDELDRCRPAFALSLLEKLKHVFNVKGVNFLLSTNLVQLQAIVKKQYGHEIDSKNYLEKFYKYVIRLPNSVESHDRDENAQILLRKYLVKDPNFEKVSNFDSSTLRLFKHLFQIHNRSLRDCEKFYNNLKIYNIVSSSDSKIQSGQPWGITTLIMLAVYIYTFDNDLTKNILSEQYTLDQISEFFKLDKTVFNSEISATNFEKEVYALLVLEIKQFPSEINQNSSPFGIIAHRLNSLVSNRLSRGERIRIFRSVIKTMQFIK